MMVYRDEAHDTQRMQQHEDYEDIAAWNTARGDDVLRLFARAMHAWRRRGRL